MNKSKERPSRQNVTHELLTVSGMQNIIRMVTKDYFIMYSIPKCSSIKDILTNFLLSYNISYNISKLHVLKLRLSQIKVNSEKT